MLTPPQRRRQSPHYLQTIASLTLTALTIWLCPSSAAGKETIENEFLRVIASDDRSLSLTAIPSGQTVVYIDAPVRTAAAPKADVSDRAFGKGQLISLPAAPDGPSGRITVFPNLPFVLIRLSLLNSTAESTNIDRFSVAKFDVHLGKPASALKTMGTGGLANASKGEGSYVWLAVVDPETGHGVVLAWLTHDRASGVLFPKVENDAVRIEARLDYGRLNIRRGQTVETETLAIGYFDDARFGLEQWADAVAKHYDIHLKPQPSGFCTWYTEKHGGAADEKSLAELTDFAAKNLEPFGFNFIQIDDHWQLGTRQGSSPKKNFTAADPKGPYPGGMKATADNIKAHGLTPGIWFMPFAGTATDPFFADKQDLFVKDDQGRIYDCTWGGNSLDMTNPKAQAYLRSVVQRIAHDWGYTYFKMDGLYTGLAVRQNYVNDAYKEEKYKEGNDNQAKPASFGDAVFFDPDKTNVEAYRDGLKLVRDAAGPDVFLLGCNMAQNMRMFGASFGLFDGMRVGPDNAGNWSRWSRSPQAASREYFLNGRIWYNDPDPQYVRGAAAVGDNPEEPNAAGNRSKSGFTTEEARTIGSWHTISGTLNTDSDWLPELPVERLNILRRTIPAHGKTARPVDYFENDPPRVWIVTDDKSETRRDVVALFNWSDKDETFDVPLARFDLPPADSYAAFDYWGNQFLPTVKGSIKATLPKHGCLVLAIRPMVNRPFVISTSRHVTQGMIDVNEERWNDATKTLSGKSDLVAGDRYELRIAATSGWKMTGGESKAVDMDVHPDSPGGVRAVITSPTNRRVEWKVVFAKGG